MRTISLAFQWQLCTSFQYEHDTLPSNIITSANMLNLAIFQYHIVKLPSKKLTCLPSLSVMISSLNSGIWSVVGNFFSFDCHLERERLQV
jgi:hypothetical protein